MCGAILAGRPGLICRQKMDANRLVPSQRVD